MQQKNSFFPLLAPMLLGAVFFVFNSIYSYQFYHVNSFKIAFMGFLMIFLFVVYDLALVGYQKIWKQETIAPFRFPWKEAMLYLLPVFATFPGFLIHLGEHVTYNLQYELTIRLVILLWMIYIIRFLKLGENLNRNIITFIIFIGAVMLYVWFFGVLESKGIAFNPIENWEKGLFTKSGKIARIKVTYGNINYLAGSLTSVLPLFLVLAIPDLKIKAEKTKIEQRDRFLFKKKLVHILFFIFFLTSFHTLFLTVTRAAIASAILSNLAVLSILLWSFMPKKRKIVSGFLVLFSFIAIIALFITFSFLYRDILINYSRFFQVFYPDVWGGRYIAWNAAIVGFLKSPIFGYGMGSSYGIFFRHIDPASRNYWVQRSYNHAHSEWLEYLVEGGILGYICFFILWGYVFYNLIKIFLSPNTSSFHKRLALGCGGGMAAFYLHGFFSVSQRQIVTHLPQFAMLAIAFVLIFFYKKKLVTTKDEQQTTNRIKKLYQDWQQICERFSHSLEKFPFVKNQLPCILIIFIGYLLYYPWAKGQSEFISIVKKGRNYLNTLQLEQLTDKRKDIYALDQLLRWQIGFRKYDKALATIDKMETTLPRYRITDFLKADIYFRQKKFKKAFELTQAYNEQDNYFLPNLRLNNKLSIVFGKPDVYLNNLNYIAQLNNPVWDENLRRNSREFYQFQFIVDDRLQQNLAIREKKDQKNTIEISFSENFFFRNFLPLALEIERTPDRKKRQQLVSKLLTRFNFELFKTAFNCQFQQKTGNKNKFFCQGGFIKIDTVDSHPETVNKVLQFLAGAFHQLDPNLDDAENEAIFKNWGHIKGRILFLKRIIKNYRSVLFL